MMKMGQQPLATANMAGVDVGLGKASPTYGLNAAAAGGDPLE